MAPVFMDRLGRGRFRYYLALRDAPRGGPQRKLQALAGGDVRAKWKRGRAARNVSAAAYISNPINRVIM
jgi:hypothetical protein